MRLSDLPLVFASLLTLSVLPACHLGNQPDSTIHGLTEDDHQMDGSLAISQCAYHCDAAILPVDCNMPVNSTKQANTAAGYYDLMVTDATSCFISTIPTVKSSTDKAIQDHTEIREIRSISAEFNAGRSIATTGSSRYQLKPVIRTYSDINNGKIEGYIIPASAHATVYAISGSDTFAAIQSAIDGHFRIGKLTEGQYQLIVVPAGISFATFSTNVRVRGDGIYRHGILAMLR